MAKSKIYKQDDDSKVSFEFGDDGKLIGIKKDGKSLDPQSQAFEDLQDSDDALEAYNINKFKVDQFLGEIRNDGEYVNIILRDHEYPDGDLIKVEVNENVVMPAILLSLIHI